MGVLGATNFLGCQADPLDVSVEVRDDSGQWVSLPLPPDLRTIVCLNTPTYAGGRFLWGKDDRKKPSKPKQWECQPQRQAPDDGLFEIVGITGTLHLGMIMVELSRGIRLAQVSEARLTFAKPIWCQADGEPFREVNPVTYHIRPLQPSTVMIRPEKAIRSNEK